MSSVATCPLWSCGRRGTGPGASPAQPCSRDREQRSRSTNDSTVNRNHLRPVAGNRPSAAAASCSLQRPETDHAESVQLSAGGPQAVNVPLGLFSGVLWQSPSTNRPIPRENREGTEAEGGGHVVTPGPPPRPPAKV